MGLSEVRDRLVRNYSGGMIRRLEIAQSTLHRPAILFMDEPTEGLDPVGRHALWSHIRGLRTRERFMGIGQVLTMPIFFASNAIYPIRVMPPWLRWISTANPLTYQVDGLRAVMLTTGRSSYGLGHDVGALAAAAVLMIAIASRMYPRMTQ